MTSRWRSSRLAGPATFIEAKAVVTGVTWIAPLGMFRLQPVEDPLPDGPGTGRRRRHHVVLVGQPAGDAVVEDHAVLGAHHAVADAAHGELAPLVDVQQVEQLRDVGTAQVELAQRRDVDDPDVRPHVAHLGRGVAVVVRADPVAGDERPRAVGVVPGLHRVSSGPARTLATGERAEGDRRTGGRHTVVPVLSIVEPLASARTATRLTVSSLPWPGPSSPS